MKVHSVMGVDEARSRLAGLLSQLSSDSVEPARDPIIMGAYRRPQGVLISVQEYEELIRVYENHRKRQSAAEAVGSVRAEGGEPDAETLADLALVAEGELSPEDAEERVLARARQWNKIPTATPGPRSSATSSTGPTKSGSNG
ncbi:antitoxin VbhA family protein [Nocardiopsis dassonvillei]|uniref:antitoxin VbhA family protein n=1 Tax=Nocardiopsis dassonvillei TaxID=2014 RepID=UPI003F563CF7